MEHKVENEDCSDSLDLGKVTKERRKQRGASKSK